MRQRCLETRSADPYHRTDRVQSRRSSVGPLVVVLLTVAMSWLAAGPAVAHGPEGKLTVLTSEAGPGRAVTIEVGILYANDEEPAEEAKVSVMLSGPEAQSVGPVTLTRVGDSGSRYRSEIPVPSAGTWNATITSAGPVAKGTAEVLVPAGTTAPPSVGNTPASTAGAGPGQPSTTRSASLTTAGTAQLRPVSPASPTPASAGSQESNTNTLIAGALIGLLGVAIAGFVVRHRNNRDEPAP